MDFSRGISRYAKDYIGGHASPWKLSNAVNAKWLDKYPDFALDPAGLVTIADLTAVARRTALTGTSSLLDALVICPGMHKQQNAPDLSKGEYPACAAMTTGYVFRVENEATVYYLQRVGRPGHLTTLAVSKPGERSTVSTRAGNLFGITGANSLSSLSYSCAAMLTIAVWLLLLLLQDLSGLLVLSLLIVTRLINAVVIQRRATLGWKGASEPDKSGDLLILLSQDRWIRMRGLVDDLKAVTSGQWLREPTFTESSLVSFATLLVFFCVALGSNARKEGRVLLLVLQLLSAALLGIANQYNQGFRMYDRTVEVCEKPRKYDRRLDLANDLIREIGKYEWAIRLGMVQPKNNESKKSDQGPKIM